ncbi:Chaperone protein DnaK [Planctomycetes bacterium Pan216]|uniref:Chaperone protein DnaK n=1 Tax=Kolteria novifilia TaxID=2527975 RepID=A0A518B4P3_9BACT|nr:Chaperone protein DnaK [Planctomycetes bacterium Pan216]
MANSDGPIVGIDLGTTNSVVAAVVNGQPQVLAEEGEKVLPSVVAVDGSGKLMTGVVARNQLAAFPERTVASIKRRMGTMDTVKLGDQSFTPPEISAMILRRLRDRASRALQQPVSRAVITVPAFFDDNQRQATREAGELAGLTVERIINEPTAATLVYHAGSRDRKQILVFDFGGGTFDVSIVRMESDVVEVLSSKGDTQLGGDDLDDALMNHVADRFQEEHDVDLRENASTRFRLLQACEQAKRQLSVDVVVPIAEEFIAEKEGRPLHLDLTITRWEFDELIEPFVDRTISCVDQALRDAALTIHQIDDLVLVGGSTRTPLVEQCLRAEFLREPSRAVDPDLAVALGAAVQAAMIDGQSMGSVLVDVTGHTLGIQACEGMSFMGPNLVFSPIIHRNSPLPARYEEVYTTLYDDQEAAEIHVLQGEHPEIHRNRSIGKFRLDLETGAGDRSKIVVRFDLTIDGTLLVTATQPATGLSKELTIDNALSQFQADERDRAEARLGAMFDASDELLEDADLPGRGSWSEGDEEEPRLPDSSPPNESADFESRFPEAVKLLARAKEVKSSVEGDDAEDLESLSEELTEAMKAGNQSAVADLCEELDDILFYVR